MITTIFSDVGGVLGTNGWDHAERQAAVQAFGLEAEEFRSRHELVADALDTGQLTLDQYLDLTVFYRSRPFSRDAFRDFMFAQSKPFPDSLALMQRLARTGKYLMSSINNESLELNLHRIPAFGLQKIFKLFLSSCFLGFKKPDPAIYQIALRLTQQRPGECIFIDDRALNLECASREGMRTIQFQSANQLEHDLRALGVEF
ncbi:MAG TPA: HAD family phosphatase [Terriglobia bacterium]|nr:HAD family phosphatase [Terriglobia bacterium]